METRRLQAFITMVDCKTLTRAAEELGIAQPSLSQQVLDLEAQFGVQLLNRTRRGVTPTAAGEVLYKHAQIVLRQLNQAAADVRSADDIVAGQIVLGLPASIGPVLSLPLLRRIRERHPSISLRITEGSYGLLEELTANGRLDLAVSSGVSNRGVHSTLLLHDELVLVSPRGQGEGSEDDPLPVSKLDGLPLVMPARIDLGRTLVMNAFRRHGLEPTIIAELESPHDLIQAVREGLGSTIVSWATAAKLAADLTVTRLNEPRLERTLVVIEPEIRPATPSSTAVKDLVFELVREMVDGGEWPGGVVGGR